MDIVEVVGLLSELNVGTAVVNCYIIRSECNACYIVIVYNNLCRYVEQDILMN